MGLFLFHVADKAQGEIVQVYLLIRAFAHGDPAALHPPDGTSGQGVAGDLKNMVPAAPLHGLIFTPAEADHLCPAEMERGKSVAQECFEKRLRVQNAALLKGPADHCTVIFHASIPPYRSFNIAEKLEYVNKARGKNRKVIVHNANSLEVLL